MEKTTKKKVLSWMSFVVSVAIFGLALAVFITSITARSKNGRAEFFGYSFAVVVTDSMAPEINVGDLIVVKKCDITEMEVGQNAVFIGLSGTFKGKSIVHQVVAIFDERSDETGEISGIYLETMGINNAHSDDDYVYADNFIGKEIFHSTVLGKIMTFLRNPINWMYLLVIILAISLGLRHGVKLIKLIKNKRQKEPSIGHDEIVEEKETVSDTNNIE